VSVSQWCPGVNGVHESMVLVSQGFGESFKCVCQSCVSSISVPVSPGSL
jgi:hypothetical protein